MLYNVYVKNESYHVGMCYGEDRYEIRTSNLGDIVFLLSLLEDGKTYILEPKKLGKENME